MMSTSSSVYSISISMVHNEFVCNFLKSCLYLPVYAYRKYSHPMAIFVSKSQTKDLKKWAQNDQFFRFFILKQKFIAKIQ